MKKHSGFDIPSTVSTKAPAGGSPSGGSRTRRTSKDVQQLQEKYPEATSAIKQMQQNMQAASLWLTQKYAQVSDDPEAKEKKVLISLFHRTQEKMNLAEATDGVWGPNTRKALESMQEYINKYHSKEDIKPLITSISAYNNLSLIKQAVENNFNSITQLLYSEGINLPGTDVTGRLAKGKALDSVPVDFTVASSQLGVEDATGVSLTASDLSSLLALKSKLISGGFNTENIGSAPIDNIEVQVFLNETTGTRMASISEATTEDLVSYFDSKPEYSAYADTYFAKTYNFLANTIVPAARNKSNNSKMFFDAFDYFYGRSLADMTREMMTGYANYFKHQLVSEQNFHQMEQLADNTFNVLNTQLSNFFKSIDMAAARRSMVSPQIQAKADKVIGMFGDPDGDEFAAIYGEVAKDFSDLKNWTMRELNNYATKYLITVDKLTQAKNYYKENPSKVPSDMNSFLGRRQQLQAVESQRSEFWTYGMLLAVAKMIKNRANYQLSLASGGKTASSDNLLQKEADIINWLRDKAKGVSEGVAEFMGGKSSSSENIKQDAITVRIKTEYARLANALINQIQVLQSNILGQLKGKKINNETLNGIVVPNEVLLFMKDSQNNKETAFGTGSNVSGNSGSEVGGRESRNNFGNNLSGGLGGSEYGTSRRGKSAPPSLPFDARQETLNLHLLEQWMKFGGMYSEGWNTELADQMSRIPIADMTSSGSLFADLPSRVGGLRNANRYLDMVRKSIYVVLKILEQNARYLVDEGDYSESQISSQYKYANNLINWIRYTQRRLGTTG